MWGVWRPVTICGHCLEARTSLVACAVCVDCCSILLENELLALKAISDGRQAGSKWLVRVVMWTCLSVDSSLQQESEVVEAILRDAAPHHHS